MGYRPWPEYVVIAESTDPQTMTLTDITVLN